MNTPTQTHKTPYKESISSLILELEERTKKTKITEEQKEQLSPLLERLSEDLDKQSIENAKKFNNFSVILSSGATGAAVGATLIGGATIAAGSAIFNPVIGSAVGGLLGVLAGTVVSNLSTGNK